MSEHLKINGKHLWYSLLALGFKPENAVNSAGIIGANARHVSLDKNMFDKPNKVAFYIVAHFLFMKLNPSRAKEQFRHCWPVLGHKIDAEFRKVSFTWIREIAAENGSDFPKVVASLFLSPGGPKFVNLMLHLVKHVMLQDMKMCATDGSWVPEASSCSAASVELMRKRMEVVKARLLKALTEQDSVMQQTQHKAQSLVKSIRTLRAEEARYHSLLKQQETESDTDTAGSINKVRSLWEVVNAMLRSVERERQVLHCVVKGNVDLPILDGTNVNISIPKALLEQLEKCEQYSHTGQLYQSGELNMLRLLELLHQALCVLECERTVGASVTHARLDVQHIRKQAQLLERSLQTLRRTGMKVIPEEMAEVQRSIQQMEATWSRRWQTCVEQKPLSAFLMEDPTLDLLSPMAPQSFQHACDTSFRSIFHQYPAKLPLNLEGNSELEAKCKSFPSALAAQEEISQTNGTTAASALTPDGTTAASALTPDGTTAASALTPDGTTAASALEESGHTHALALQHTARVDKVNSAHKILDRECDNLAQQFAEAVMCSPAEQNVGRVLHLDDLLFTLPDPFSTRKQLPRTPDSLLQDVKSSWRRAVEEEETGKPGRSPRAVQRLAHKLCDVDTPCGLSEEAKRPAEADGSYANQRGIHSETMPGLLGNESFLSSSDGEPEKVAQQEEPHMWEACGELSFTDARADLDQHLLQSQADDTHETSDGARMFSLDLEALESPSPSKGRFSLPPLVSFSPMEDL